MQESYVIGIDVGTGSTKAIAVDNTNEVLCSAQQFYSSTTDGEKSEQDVHTVYRSFLQCIKEIVDRLQHPPAAISLSCAMHSVLAVDSEGKPLTAAILWSDTRSNAVAEALRNTETGKTIYLATGTPLHSMSPLCKIKWLQECEPQIFSKAAKFISTKEFIWHQLFGEYVIDYSLASATGLFNIHQLKWDEKALHFAGIGPEKLSLPVSVTYKNTLAKKSVAESTELPLGTTFFVGASDGTLANLGSLCLRPSEAAITIGTSAAVRITSAKPVQNAERMIFNYLLDEENFVCGGAINNGGNVFGWLLKNLFSENKKVSTYEELFSRMATVSPGSDGLLFLPYLHGERAPIWDEKSNGAYVGVTSTHTLAHFARASAEGVCFALYHILSSLENVCGPVQRLLVSGGVVHAGVMMQLLANVSGKQVVVQQNEDASAMGAVYMAQKELGIIQDYSSIAEKESSLYEPQLDEVSLYRKRFDIYKQIYPRLKDQMHSLYQLTR